MRRRSIWIFGLIAAAAVVVIVIIGVALRNSPPPSYSHLLTQYLRARSSNDAKATAALVSGEFVNELADIDLVPGTFRAYDFGEQGAPSKDTAVLRFAVVVLEGDEKAAYLADAVFHRKGARAILTALRKIGTGRPIVD